MLRAKLRPKTSALSPSSVFLLRVPVVCEAPVQPLTSSALGVVMPQAPVSDREYLETLPGTAAFVEEARTRGGGEELMPVAADEAPITPERCLSLATKVQ